MLGLCVVRSLISILHQPISHMRMTHSLQISCCLVAVCNVKESWESSGEVRGKGQGGSVPGCLKGTCE